MKKSANLVLIVLSVLALVLGAQISCAQTSSKGLSSQDKDFVNKAASGGMMEVKLGEMASKQGANEAVRKFGAHMVTDHSKANQELMQIAHSKDITVPKEMEKEHQNEVDRLSKLNGPAFDRAYMDLMVRDHQKDISEFQKEASSGQDPDIKSFASKTVPTLQQHLNMAKDTQAKLGSAAQKQ